VSSHTRRADSRHWGSPARTATPPQRPPSHHAHPAHDARCLPRGLRAPPPHPRHQPPPERATGTSLPLSARPARAGVNGPARGRAVKRVGGAWAGCDAPTAAAGAQPGAAAQGCPRRAAWARPPVTRFRAKRMRAGRTEASGRPRGAGEGGALSVCVENGPRHRTRSATRRTATHDTWVDSPLLRGSNAHACCAGGPRGAEKTPVKVLGSAGFPVCWVARF
jgi:hypothetical protein